MYDLAFIDTQQPDVPVNPEANDISFENGDLAVISGEPRVFQDLAKILLTQIGSDSIAPTYGSDIPGLTGAIEGPNLMSRINDGVSQAVSFLVANQHANTPNETITGIQVLSVTQPAGNPYEIDINLILNLQNGSTVEAAI